MNGILLVHKPEGVTSAEVVRWAKGRFRVKVGHLGTLDPFATGVLPLCLGEATRIAQFLNTAEKEYTGVLRLGEKTDSGDRTGEVRETAPVPDFGDAALRNVESRLQGESFQVPPMFSALKRDGVPLYALARRGIEVDREPRPIRIEELELSRLDSSTLRFRVCCSKGTYVRVLAEDIGRELGTVAHLSELRRTRFGPFGIEKAVAIEGGRFPERIEILTVRTALSHLPNLQVDAGIAAAARQGKTAILARLPPPKTEVSILVDPEDSLVAVLVRDGDGWAYGRVFGCQTLHSSGEMLAPRVEKKRE